MLGNQKNAGKINRKMLGILRKKLGNLRENGKSDIKIWENWEKTLGYLVENVGNFER